MVSRPDLTSLQPTMWAFVKLASMRIWLRQAPKHSNANGPGHPRGWTETHRDRPTRRLKAGRQSISGPGFKRGISNDAESWILVRRRPSLKGIASKAT